MSQPIWILGASGYVGGAYQRLLESRGIPFRVLPRTALDYYNVSTLTAALKEAKPAFLVNCAGYTGKPNVDACELHKTECLLGNAILPGVLRQACEATGTPWGHVSSGCIFTGRRRDGGGLRETDAPNFSFRTNNCSFYSGTKALGEEVLAGADNCFIWRLRIPFNEVDSPRNYLTKLMRYDRLLEAENSLSQLDEFVRATWECWEKHVPFGTYNVTNPGAVTTREVVVLIQQSGVSKKHFAFFSDEADFMQKAAKTPRSNCVLDSSKLLASGIVMSEVHDAIAKALKNWKAA
ncbi:MAG: sugar nucleotide-binding protein [Chthoniobacter sp.]|uniref:sugar nucleotide-binding protein n=1 Tax=Chthoniobacter sp. TaxID=2510640 RepID=UPI0032A4813E